MTDQAGSGEASIATNSFRSSRTSGPTQRTARPTVGSMPTRDEPTGDGPQAGRRAGRRFRGTGEHPVLLDKADDKWAWRRRIRSDPRKARIYRIGVAIAGLFLVVLGALSGPLPGPGGIPLVLLGLAVWASEFEWAQRVMEWFKRRLHQFRGWGRPAQALAWTIFFLVIGIVVYGYLVIAGVPVWVPDFAADKLHVLPGI